MMNVKNWLKRANSKLVRTQVKEQKGFEDFQAIINFTHQLNNVNWVSAIALLHMVYGWMPTMLRPIKPYSDLEKNEVLNILMTVKNNREISLTKDELSIVKDFSNGSVVGMSKLLHILNPASFAIWDSRVARTFLRRKVYYQTYSDLERYIEYLKAVREWAALDDVKNICNNLRQLNPKLQNASNLRIVEYVLFARKSNK